jgi:hypothetical protein
MFGTLRTLFGRNPDAELILQLKRYCDRLFGAALPGVDLKAFMTDAQSLHEPDRAALRLVLGLYVLDFPGNVFAMLSMDDRSAVAAVLYLYSDQFGLEGDAAEALRESAVAFKTPAIEKMEKDGENAELDSWPDEAALAVVYLAGATAERVCGGYQKNQKAKLAPSEDEVGNFNALCANAVNFAAENMDGPAN